MIAVIIQARMGSSRMPGKTMKKINEKPLLFYSVQRCRLAKYVDLIIVATTTSQKDNIISEWCHKNSIDCFRGSEEDVLDRYYQTAKEFGVNIIVRVTSDCPFVDPNIVDMLIKVLLDSDFDYVSNRIHGRTYPHGIDVEVFRFQALGKAWKAATEQQEREHVTPYILNHPEIFMLKEVPFEENLSNYRLTVDYPEDFEFARVLIEDYSAAELSWQEIIDILKKNPNIAEINAKWNIH